MIQYIQDTFQNKKEWKKITIVQGNFCQNLYNICLQNQF